MIKKRSTQFAQAVFFSILSFNEYSIKSIHDIQDLVFMFKFLKSEDKHFKLKLYSFRAHCYNEKATRQLTEYHRKLVSTYFSLYSD